MSDEKKKSSKRVSSWVSDDEMDEMKHRTSHEMEWAEDDDDELEDEIVDDENRQDDLMR